MRGWGGRERSGGWGGKGRNKDYIHVKEKEACEDEEGEGGKEEVK